MQFFWGGHEGGGSGDFSAREGFVSGGGGGLVEGECGGAILGVPVLVDGVARVCMSVGYRGSWAGLGSSVRSGGTETRREGLSRRAWEGRQVREGWRRGRSAEERLVGRPLAPPAVVRTPVPGFPILSGGEGRFDSGRPVTVEGGIGPASIHFGSHPFLLGRKREHPFSAGAALVGRGWGAGRGLCLSAG